MDPKKKPHVDEIRRVHKNLRKEFQRETDFMKVWDSHCNDDDALQKYAKAMEELATGIWDEDCDGTHRIEWCRKTCEDYFCNGLKKLLEKDQRRKAHYEIEKSSFIRGPSPLQPLLDEETETKIRTETRFPCPPPDGKLQLLDVGSCYDPFGKFEEFETTAIDLNPANENVQKCDFIKVQVSPGQNEKQIEPDSSYNSKSGKEEIDEHHTENCKKRTEITTLPSSFFHVVVFSLLLTYIPCPRKRWEMCQKAHKVLTTNGLFLIITPDSSHQNKNAALMKRWKNAIEAIGFQRIVYSKDTHLHFMAFRKVPPDFLWDRRRSEEITDGVEEEKLCLNIPQDFHEYEDSETEYKFDADFVKEGINELPQI